MRGTGDGSLLFFLLFLAGCWAVSIGTEECPKGLLCPNRMTGGCLGVYAECFFAELRKNSTSESIRVFMCP